MLRDDALKGKTIVVTGGGSGLGKAMTTYFLELGANVVITSRNLEKLQTVKEELEAATGTEYADHLRTYEGFIHLAKYGTIAVVIILILMAFFLL